MISLPAVLQEKEKSMKLRYLHLNARISEVFSKPATSLLSLLLLCILLAPAGFAAEAFTYHPADTSKDKYIDEDEALAYANLWQEGTERFTHAVRALYLWQMGGGYDLDPALNPLRDQPLCWVPYNAGAQIILFGPATDSLECTESYEDAGAEARDEDGTILDITTTITLGGVEVEDFSTGLTNPEGDLYLITYTTETNNGATLSATREVLVKDTTPPVVEPTKINLIQQELQVYGYKGVETVYDSDQKLFHVHLLGCNADWDMIDSGTALDSCGADGAIDYWDDVMVTVNLLNDNFVAEVDGDDNPVTVPLDEFTEQAGLYRLDYSVSDASGNVGVYNPTSYLRYVRVEGTTVVPQLIGTGLIREEAEERALAAHLVPSFEEAYHDSVTAGLMISQSLESGSTVECGTEIELIISKGACIPPVVLNMQLEDAKTLIEAAGFVVGEEVGIDSMAPAGTVTSTSQDGSGCGSLINLVYSLGPCDMPDVQGLSADDAIALIEAAGFETPAVVYYWNSDVDRDLVISQFPNAGPRECNFSGIHLNVSLGVQPMSVELDGGASYKLECGTLWTVPQTHVLGAYLDDESQIHIVVLADLEAVSVQYYQGEDLVDFDVNTPLTLDQSPLRVTYSFTYEAPNAHDGSILEPVELTPSFEFAVFDTEAPILDMEDTAALTVNDLLGEDTPEDLDGAPLYLFNAGDYANWDAVESAGLVTVHGATDLCDGDLPLDSIVRVVLMLPGEEDDDDADPTLVDENDPWMSTRGAYAVAYMVEDSSENEISSLRFVIIGD